MFENGMLSKKEKVKENTICVNNNNQGSEILHIN